MRPSSHLRDELCSLGTAFTPNELAYLALTSKVEFALRDKLAVRLSRRLRGHFYVSREWPRRSDLAIFDCNSVQEHGVHSRPCLLLEAKAMYSFDAIPTRVESSSFERNYLPQLRTDLEKARQLGSHTAQVYGLLLVTHPTGPVPRHLAGIVKYSRMINSRHMKLGPTKLWKEVCAHIKPRLRTLGAVVQGSWDAGTAFDVPCTVGYWLIRSTV